MHWQHGWDEDASGTMDETVREVAVTVQEYWRELLNVVGGREKRRAMLYDLKEDPYEDVDVAARYPDVVEEMLARVVKMESHFPKNCDWFVMDRNLSFEKVKWVDDGGVERVSEYHSPFVRDEDMAEYEPWLFNVNPARKYAAAGIVALEAFVMVWVAAKVLLWFWRAVLGWRKEKGKRD